MGIAGIGKGGALFGTGTTAAFVDLGLAPGTTDQREDLSFRKSLTSVATLQHFFHYGRKVEMIYTLFWMSLFPVAWFGAVSNHDKDGNGLVVERLMVGIGDITIGIPTLVAAYVDYFPPLVALVLCWIGGDKMSWRWPFQKESVVGTFGLFVHYCSDGQRAFILSFVPCKQCVWREMMQL